MEIRDVPPEELDYVAATCLDPSVPPKWREAMKSAMDARKQWLKAMMLKGLQMSIALRETERGNFPKGLIEYMPIEFAPEPVKGEKSLFIDCVWVVPPYWHKGIGKAFLERFIEKARRYGGASVLAYEGDKWFGFFPYMPVSFFKRFGFREVDRDGSRVLLHLNLGADEQPTLICPKAKTIEKGDKMVVDVLFNSQCPWSGWMVDKIKRNMKKYNAVVNAINTNDRKIIEEYGLSRGVYINGSPTIKRMASWKEIESFIKQAVQH